ncbi:hypothetical protein [Candidatus Magnetobacterium casense]|uniref:Capsid protein n=1 Tax=Candidatus Magnetobacterium casense TaxID=1455061 RepID=A0ABS6S412_9BACT|nr:hypothetical protein [Candidatus Magnetobacterium casensis]MBV6343330.1 hypothetical protein [Candidatus Magnetobacterium casensis]
MMVKRPITTNTASVKEAYQVPVVDGNVVFFRQIALSDVIYDRAQTVAQAYQEFRIKYVKMTFRPSADTFPAVAGNIIPQLYWQIDKANAIPLTADADTFYSMGTRPRRMDDKNLSFVWKPTVLTTDMTNPGVTNPGSVRLRPWLSTNANAGNPGAWAPSAVEHLGCVFYVTKINPADALVYNIDVEVVFQFRKPTWRGGSSTANSVLLTDGQIKSVTQTPPLVT